MVDAQPVQRSVGQHREDEFMRVIEKLGELHAQAGEIIDIEEAPVIDLIGGDKEMGGAPVLILDESVEFSPGVQLSRLSVQTCDRVIQSPPHIVSVPHQCGKFHPQVPGAAGDARTEAGRLRECVAQCSSTGCALPRMRP